MENLLKLSLKNWYFIKPVYLTDQLGRGIFLKIPKDESFALLPEYAAKNAGIKTAWLFFPYPRGNPSGLMLAGFVISIPRCEANLLAMTNLFCLNLSNAYNPLLFHFLIAHHQIFYMKNHKEYILSLYLRFLEV